MNPRANPLLVLGVLLLVPLGLRAQQGQEPAGAPFEQFLQRLAGQYPVGSLFRFDPPGETSKEPILNQPEALGMQFERRLEKLPKAGAAEVVPWSGWWWPMRGDGVAAGGANSPMAKYARAFCLGDAPVQWERQNHGSGGSQKPEAWWGHCNGWAAAAILEAVPAHSVQRNGVTLTATDVSGLLCSVYFGCRAIGLDDRYAGSDEPAVDRFGRPTDRTYRDVNPAVLHLLACNRIGVDKKAFVADISPGSQVWNHPVWAFEVRELRELRDGAAAVEAITAKSHSGPYPFHPAAVRFFAVTSKFRVTLGLNGTEAPANAGNAARNVWMEYRYVLETDKDGNVIGGEWALDSRKNHPDFCWVPLTPSSSYTVTPDGRTLVGTTGIGNPYVVYEDLAPLARESAGLPPLPAVAAAGPQANSGSTPATAPAPAASTSSVAAAAARRDQGVGRWNRPDGAADPRWTRVFQVAQSQLQRAELPQAIATLSAPLQQAQQGQLQLPVQVQQELQLQRGWLYFLVQEPQQAMADYAQLPNDGALGPSVRARRALFAIARGDGVRALAEAAQAIAQNPKNPWGYCARAWVYLSRQAEHDLERAREDIATATRLGADPFVLFTGAQVQQAQQQQQQRAQGVAAGPQQQQPTSAVPAQLDALPAQWAQMFQAQVRGIQMQQDKKQ